ncbi:MAG: hypothetical protein DRH15_10295 [Deltaproteobacteria bacterium]|nr:MAG: hypothetical protein DRH15_10295 [Deltaproteobacteria bacterium]
MFYEMDSMNKISLCFHAHQPTRLRRFYPLEGYLSELSRSLYFDIAQDYSVFMRMNYEKALNHILEWLERDTVDLYVYVSGIFIEQCAWSPELMELLKRIMKIAEPVCSPYYYSLSCFYPLLTEFCHQVKLHISKIEDIFGKTSSVFINPHLTYTPELNSVLRDMGVNYVIARHDEFTGKQDSTLPKSVSPRMYEDRNWSGGVLWMDLASPDIYSLPDEIERRGVDIVPIWELAEDSGDRGDNHTSSISPSNSSKTLTQPPLKNHAQSLFYYEVSSLCTYPMSPLERDIYGRLQQFDILLEMGSPPPTSVIYTLNALSILSDFKRRMWR